MTDTATEAPATLMERMDRIAADIELGMNCTLIVGIDPREMFDIDGNRIIRPYFQIQCWRRDTITGEMGNGYGGKAYPSEFASESELIQAAFGKYKEYWEHEARETFIYRERRPFGPHIKTEALWSVARQVDLRSATHADDKPGA